MLKNNIIYNEYSSWVFGFKKAEGSYVWTHKNKRLIDFTSGWNVTNLGWNNKQITKQLIKQAKVNHYAPMWTADPIQEKYASELINSLPKGLNSIGRATGGTEANEEAIKSARAYTGRKKIIGFKDTYHGQSFGTMSIGYLPSYVKDISPMVGGFVQIDFPISKKSKISGKQILKSFESRLDKLLSKRDIAALVTEAGIVTGWGDVKIAPNGYLKLVRRLTKKYGTLLILDEVGTGFSRCGKLFGMEIEGVIPDIVTLAKGMSNGAAAIGAMVTKKEIANKVYDKSNITSTFGWTPVGCAVALETLKIHKKEKLWIKANKDGDYILKMLNRELKNNRYIQDIRGLGMEIGIEFAEKDRKTGTKKNYIKSVIYKARDNGLHLVGDNESVIQLMPPLTIERQILEKGLAILVETIKELH